MLGQICSVEVIAVATVTCYLLENGLGHILNSVIGYSMLSS